MQIRQFLPIAFILLAGCSPILVGLAPDNSQPASLSQPGQPAGASSVVPGQSPSQADGQPATQPVTKPAAPDGNQPVSQPVAPKAPPAGAPLTISIDSPLDKAVVSSSTLEITGKVSRQAVLTINESTFVIPAGSFTEPITLAEGPNSIQIVASDTSGNEVDLVLTVTYQP